MCGGGGRKEERGRGRESGEGGEGRKAVGRRGSEERGIGQTGREEG